MTTAKTQMPPKWPFSPQDCEAMVAANIIAEGEQADVLSGARLFNVDEYMAIAEAGILRKEDRVELMDGEIIVMAPIGPPHEEGTDWLTMGLAPALAGRAMVRVQGSVQLDDLSLPEPDVIVSSVAPARFGTVDGDGGLLRHRGRRQYAALRQRAEAGPVRRGGYTGGVDR